MQVVRFRFSNPNSLDRLCSGYRVFQRAGKQNIVITAKDVNLDSFQDLFQNLQHGWKNPPRLSGGIKAD
jgi:hypothetical protein